MVRSLTLWVIWLGFILYLLMLAPPLQPDTLQPLQSLLAGQLPAINPVILSLFSLVGIWLLIYSGLMFVDGRMQSLPAWGFMLAAIATGVFALIPYLFATWIPLFGPLAYLCLRPSLLAFRFSNP